MRQAFGAGPVVTLPPPKPPARGSLGRVGLKPSPSALHGQAQGPLMLGTGTPHSWVGLDSLSPDPPLLLALGVPHDPDHQH